MMTLSNYDNDYAKLRACHESRPMPWDRDVSDVMLHDMFYHQIDYHLIIYHSSTSD